MLKAAYTGDVEGLRFSALQRAENSSMFGARSARLRIERFSALQRAENSSIDARRRRRDYGADVVSVLFSEPKIPQYPRGRRADAVRPVFQCSSASRKFLNYRSRCPS